MLFLLLFDKECRRESTKSNRKERNHMLLSFLKYIYTGEAYICNTRSRHYMDSTEQREQRYDTATATATTNNNSDALIRIASSAWERKKSQADRAKRKRI